MDKRLLEPLELIEIATQHAYAAESLLNQSQREHMFMPVISLIYAAFHMTLKAYIIFEHKPMKQPKTLLELVELNHHLNLSHADKLIIKRLNMQQAFRKGFSWDLFDNTQDLHVFCVDALNLYERLQGMMPIELHPEYQSA